MLVIPTVCVMRDWHRCEIPMFGNIKRQQQKDPPSIVCGAEDKEQTARVCVLKRLKSYRNCPLAQTPTQRSGIRASRGWVRGARGALSTKKVRGENTIYIKRFKKKKRERQHG